MVWNQMIHSISSVLISLGKASIKKNAAKIREKICKMFWNVKIWILNGFRFIIDFSKSYVLHHYESIDMQYAHQKITHLFFSLSAKNRVFLYGGGVRSLRTCLKKMCVFFIGPSLRNEKKIIISFNLTTVTHITIII